MRLLRFYFIATNIALAVAVRIDVFAFLCYYIVLAGCSMPVISFIVGPVCAVCMLVRLLRFYFITTNITLAVAVRVDVFAFVCYYIVLAGCSMPVIGFIVGPVFAVSMLVRLFRFYFITTNIALAVAVRVDVFAFVCYYIVLAGCSMPVVGFIVGPVCAVGVLVRLLDFSYMSAYITFFISVISVDMFCHILDAAFLIWAFCIRALMPVVLVIFTPVTIDMLMNWSFIDSHFTCLCPVNVETRFLIRETILATVT